MSTNINLKNSTDTTFSIIHSDGANTKVLDSKDIAVAVDTVADFPANPNNGDVVIVRDLDRGGTFIYDSSEVAGSNDGTNFDGWIRQYSGALNVKWFGAKGDGIGSTPFSTGIDISAAPWNTWDGTLFKDNLDWSPYNNNGVFSPPRAKPFENTDTWDYIGISLALWNSSTTFIPAGTYIINISGTGGLIIMKGMEQTIFGDDTFKTILTTKETASFFTENTPYEICKYSILHLYRVGGASTHIKDLNLSGPYNFDSACSNLCLIKNSNTNGVNIRNMWLSSASYGIYYTDNSGDSFINGVTSEYLFKSSIYFDTTSEARIDFCNFWASASIYGQCGVVSTGNSVIPISNTKFVNFYGNPISLKNGIISNNVFSLVSSGNVHCDNGVVEGNYFYGGTNTSLLAVTANCTIVGNTFEQTGNHPCINIGNGISASATDINISGNIFKKTNTANEPQNYAIIAIEDGHNYIGAATNKCIIANNIFNGRALTEIGFSYMSNNVYDGIYQGVGNNANGEYIKFPDGTLICRQFYLYTGNPVSNIDYTWTFPSSFINTPSISFSFECIYQNVGYRNAFVKLNPFYSPAVTQYSAYISAYSNDSFNQGYLHLTAIGRWK